MAAKKPLINIILGGASITRSPWPTWADIVKDRYRANHIDTSQKGLGNEAILLKMLNAAYELSESKSPIFLIAMLTNVDKWDWYVDREDLIQKYQKEKHNIVRISNANGGFWSTGSWFPLEKEVYKNTFYSQDYFTLKTLQVMSMFKHVCHQQGWRYLILFDSPIWSMTEQDINANLDISDDRRLIQTPLCTWFYEISGAADNVYEPGMIGYLSQQNLPWFSPKWKGHPGPLSQLSFAKKHVIPILDPQLEHIENDKEIDDIMHRMNELWIY